MALEATDTVSFGRANLDLPKPSTLRMSSVSVDTSKAFVVSNYTCMCDNQLCHVIDDPQRTIVVGRRPFVIEGGPPNMYLTLYIQGEYT